MNTTDNTTTIIRSIGITSIVLASINFMVGGRYDLNSIDTHYMFLGVNILLAILGFTMGKVFKDYKSSRTFFSLSLAMVPVHMAQLGGFIFTGNQDISTCIAITIVTLVPIISLGFNILDRNSAKKHAFLFSFASLVILIPIREANITYLFILSSLLMNYIFSIKDIKLATFEAKLSALFIFLPSFLMLGRLAYYPMDTLFYSITSASVALTCGYIQNRVTEKKLLQSALVYLSGLSLFVFSIATGKLVNFTEFYYIGLIFGALMLGFSFYVNNGGKVVRLFATLVTTLSLFPGFIEGSLKQDIVLIVFPVICLISALKTKERTIFTMALTTLFIGIIIIASQVITMPSLGAWQTLIICGIILILVAGIYDKKKISIKNFYTEFKNSME